MLESHEITEDASPAAGSPSVTIVFLVYNRREELRESLRRMLSASDYDRERVDAIVVDNASTDGSAAMVREQFPGVRLIERSENVGVSGWNEGLAAATGDYVLLLDDDCYLPADGLRRAVAAAERNRADLVSFAVESTRDPDLVFTDRYRTGLFLFWGCAALMRRDVVRALGGYDPEIFVLANELEFMLRFYDRGYRHLYMPELVAQHMKASFQTEGEWGYRHNARHWAYIVAKHLRARDAAGTLVALTTIAIRDGLYRNPPLRASVGETIRGLVRGLRQRQPVRATGLSRLYRRSFYTFANRWWMSPPETVRRLVTSPSSDRRGLDAYEDFHRRNARFYPSAATTMEFGPAGPVVGPAVVEPWERGS